VGSGFSWIWSSEITEDAVSAVGLRIIFAAIYKKT
jgi:hypothetical protein